MNHKLKRLSQGYAAALQKHLKQSSGATLQPARGLGHKAVSLGLETLDVARVHEAALASLEASSSRDGIIKRSQMFFTEAITPIEQTHRAAVQAKARLTQANRTLDRRTAELATSNQSLQ